MQRILGEEVDRKGQRGLERAKSILGGHIIYIFDISEEIIEKNIRNLF